MIGSYDRDVGTPTGGSQTTPRKSLTAVWGATADHLGGQVEALRCSGAPYPNPGRFMGEPICTTGLGDPLPLRAEPPRPQIGDPLAVELTRFGSHLSQNIRA